MNEQLDIERAERDGIEFFYGGEWNTGLWIGPIECRGEMMDAVGYLSTGARVVVPWCDVRNIPAAAPSPGEHTVAVAIWGCAGEYVADSRHSTQKSFGATAGVWRGCNEALPRIELHFRDGVPIAYTKDGVRVEVAMVGDWTCAACQFTIHGVHQIVTDDGPTDEWQIPPCEHCAAAASQELADLLALWERASRAGVSVRLTGYGKWEVCAWGVGSQGEYDTFGGALLGLPAVLDALDGEATYG